MVIKKNTITYILSYMSNFSKCYNKWWPAIWSIIILAIVIVLILFSTNIYGKEYPDKTRHQNDKVERQELMELQNSIGNEYRKRLDALFTKWDSILNEERKEIGTTLRTIATSLSIWVGLIAAICTILPIVLGINTNLNFKNDVAHAEKRMFEKSMDNARNIEKRLAATRKETEKQIEKARINTKEEIDKSVNESKKQIEQITADTESKLNKLEITIEDSKQSFEESRIQHILSDLSVHMRVLSELQEFDSKDKGTLTKPSLLLRVLKNLVCELENVEGKIQPDNKEEQMFVSIVLMLCMLKRLLISVESTFKDYNLLSLQKIRSKIDKTITDLMSVPKGTANNKYLISEACKYSTDIQNLFKDYIEEDKDKSERK